MMTAAPRAAQMGAGSGLLARSARNAAISATAGIGHGADMPLPQPTATPIGTVIGRPTPNGSPSMFSRTARMDPSPESSSLIR
jgi:hypothetical protein